MLVGPTGVFVFVDVRVKVAVGPLGVFERVGVPPPETAFHKAGTFGGSQPIREV